MLKAITSYEKDKLLRGSKLIVPFLLLLAYIAIAYAVAPLNILTSFSVSALFLFILMLSAGVMADDVHYQTVDQAILVKMPRKAYFYFGKVVVLGLISLVFALLSVLLPLLLNLFAGCRLFNRAVVFSDIASGFLLFWLVGFCGGVSGLFTNYRIISNRKAAVLAVALFGVLVIVKGSLIGQVPALSYALWVLPPVYDLCVNYSKTVYFSIGGAWASYLWLAAYIAVEIAVYVKVMLKRGFE